MIALTTMENLPARVDPNEIASLIERAESHFVSLRITVPKHTQLNLKNNTSLSVTDTIAEIEAKIKEEQGE